MPTKALPKDKGAPLIVHCRSGARAKEAAAFLQGQGYSNVLNAGGPEGPAAPWEALAYGELATGGKRHAHVLGKFAQLFDGPAPEGGGSCTYTYILGDEASGEAIIIDPVLEHVDRDLAAAEAMGCKLTLALNTHCHADHITGSGALKRRVPTLKSIISSSSGAKADRHIAHGDLITWAGGRRALRVLATPGHTNGCVSYVDETLGAVFTGDALFIGGCGRTDFQEGSSSTLFDSVTRHLFSLPGSTLVLPAHDYQGRLYTTVAAEKASNPRFTLGKAGFIEFMANLELPHPKKLDVSLPANLKCGLD